MVFSPKAKGDLCSSFEAWITPVHAVCLVLNRVFYFMFANLLCFGWYDSLLSYEENKENILNFILGLGPIK